MKPLIVVAMLFLLPATPWAGTFIETFDDDALDEWQEIILLDFNPKPGSWEIIGGELHGTNPDQVSYILTMGDERWRNYTIEVDVKILENPHPGNIGIAARIQETIGVINIIGGMSFPLPKPGSNANCFGGDFLGNKFWFFGSEVSPFLELETWFTMKLQVNEEIFTLWLNGNQVLQARDDTFNFSTGRVGLVLTSYTARFDNFIISGEGIPNKGRLPVEPNGKLATTWGALKVNP